MAVDYFLKIDGIDGESPDSKHAGDIDLESFSWGATQTGAHSFGGGGGEGEHIKKAVLVCRKAGKEQQEFLKVTMSDLLVSSFQTGGSAHGDEVPVDQVSLNFSKIEWEYKEQKSDGTLGGTTKTGYDLKAMKKV